jgi:hypothetical protein
MRNSPIPALSTSLLSAAPACLLPLRKIWNSLPKQHERIARFVMLNTADFLAFDVRRIAHRCGYRVVAANVPMTQCAGRRIGPTY